MADDEVAGVFGSAVHGFNLLEHVALDGDCEGLGGRGAVESLEATDIALPGEVVVNGDEDGVGVAIAEVCAAGEGDELVAATGHHGFETFAAELFLDAERGVEGEPFLVNFAVASTVVTSAVSGIDHDGVKFCKSRAQESER